MAIPFGPSPNAPSVSDASITAPNLQYNMASTPSTTANLYTPKQENKENVPKWELNFVGFLAHGGYFFAYEEFWKFFVFRRRKIVVQMA